MRFYLILSFIIIGLYSCVNHPDSIQNSKKSDKSLIICNGLPNSAKDYFKSLKFPFYSIDSLSYETDEISSNENYLNFENCDDSIFSHKTNADHYKYISLQDTTKFISLLIDYGGEGESHVDLFVVDNDYKIKSREVLFITSFDVSFPIDFNYRDTIVNFYQLTEKMFFQENKYKVISSEYYKLKSPDGKELIDIGQQTIKTFKVSGNGIIIKSKFQTKSKDYANAIWKAI
jgi:hypothetical protein